MRRRKAITIIALASLAHTTKLGVDHPNVVVTPTFIPHPDTDAASRSASLVVPTTPATGQMLSVTSYCLPGPRTASGVPVGPGIAASNLYPFGAVLEVPGWGEVRVEDRVGWGTDLDLWQNSCTGAVDWGRKYLYVTEVK